MVLPIPISLSPDPPRTLYFSSEIEDKKALKARFAIYPMDVTCSIGFPDYTPSIRFTESELKDIEIFRDKDNRAWLKTLPLSLRLTNWLLQNKKACMPVEDLKTIGEIVFHFETSGLGDTASESSSEIVSFKGFEKSGDAYNASVALKQGRVK